MLTDIVKAFISFFDTSYQNLDISTHLADLLDKLNKPFEYVETFKYFIQGAYFVFGKPLFAYMISVIVIILAIRIIMAIVNLVYP